MNTLMHQLDSTRLTILAPAKVNWYLELLRKRDDGFHQIETLMSTVSLYDTLSFQSRDDGETTLTIAQDLAQPESLIPAGPSNLVWRAVDAVRERCEAFLEPRGVDIKLAKRIPSAAGLGGASSDAAATVVALNQLWALGLSFRQQWEIASELGSDVPFFLTGGAALCEGRGELISRVTVPSRHWIVIGKPATGLSTPEVFAHVKISDQQHRFEAFRQYFEAGRTRLIGDAMYNRLQEFALPLNEQIQRIQNEFQTLHDQGRCCGHQLSGSGSSYFGLFPSQRLARQAWGRLRGRLPGIGFYCCHTLGPCRLGKSDCGAAAA